MASESLKVGYACALTIIAKGANARVMKCHVWNFNTVWKSSPCSRGGRYQNNVVTIYHVLVITIFDIITILRFG